MTLSLVTPPTELAVSLVEAKAHLRVDHSDEDTKIDLLIRGATGYAEAFLGRALVDQTWDLYLDEFPAGPIVIPLSPMLGVDGVFYSDGAGGETEILTFDVDQVGTVPRVSLSAGASWPTLTAAPNAVRIRFRAGYVDLSASPPTGAIPADIKSAVLLTLGTLYANREGVVIGASVAEMPLTAERLLRSHRVNLSLA